MDDLASQVLRDFNANRPEGWTVPRREAWSRFIVGLILRNPENLERIKAHKRPSSGHCSRSRDAGPNRQSHTVSFVGPSLFSPP
jgi:hypothetical protein